MDLSLLRALLLRVLSMWLIPCSALAGLLETVEVIERLLDSGEKVAVLFVDMRTGAVRRYEGVNFLIQRQLNVMTVYEEDPRVSFFEFLVGPGSDSVPVRLVYDAIREKQLALKTREIASPHPEAKEGFVEIYTQEDTYKEALYTQVSEVLKAENIDNVVLMGAGDMTGIAESAQEMLDQGRNVWVDHDLCLLHERDEFPLSEPSPSKQETIEKSEMLWRDMDKRFGDKLNRIRSKPTSCTP